MEPASHNERRAHYRLRYPPAERPTLKVEDRDYQVAELSEGGARIVIVAACLVPLDRPFQGTLRFHDGEHVAIEGKVLRSEGRELIVTLSQGVSFHRMMAEQRRIRAKYPMFFDPRGN